LDYSVDKISSKEIPKDRGFDFERSVDDTSGREADRGSDTYSDSSRKFLSEVDVRRLGSFTFPVEMEAVFADGDTERENWDGKDVWKKFKYTRPSRLVSATVDPERKIVLDVNFTNNSKTMDSQSLGVNKTSMRFLFWVQFLLDEPESLN